VSSAVARPDAATWADVQGLVVSGYASMHEARLLLLAVDDPVAARRWIGDVAGRVTDASGPEARRCVNLGFTAAGLRALGLTDRELATFPAPFTEGISAEQRRRALGDDGPSHPENWAWGGTAPDAAIGADRIHAVLLLYARDAATIDEVVAEETALLAGSWTILHTERPEPLPGALTPDGKLGVEHFGFADGISRVLVRDSGQEDGVGWAETQRSVIEAGEFVLGYANGYAKCTPWPRLDASGPGGERFGVNGTFLVVRKLAQDVAGFRRWTTAEAARVERDPEWLAAKVVGRWRSGAPLALAPDADDPDLALANEFGFADIDPDGMRCPFGAHIRRTNPRDWLLDDPVEAQKITNLHRLIRRGRVYGPGLAEGAIEDDGIERGLLFLAVNGNIERQFEFVQHSWVVNPTFHGLAGESDPLIANAAGGGTFRVPADPVRQRAEGIPSFVTVRAGAYFFLPGIAALRTLGARS
jgi:Dyp-type peroxidase family